MHIWSKAWPDRGATINLFPETGPGEGCQDQKEEKSQGRHRRQEIRHHETNRGRSKKIGRHSDQTEEVEGQVFGTQTEGNQASQIKNNQTKKEIDYIL